MAFSYAVYMGKILFPVEYGQSVTSFCTFSVRNYYY